MTNLLTREEIEDHPSPEVHQLIAHIRELHEQFRVPYRDSILNMYEAADYLNVSVEYLLNDGTLLPWRVYGKVVHYKYEDLYDYKTKRDAERRAALADLTRWSYENGMYDLPEENGS